MDGEKGGTKEKEKRGGIRTGIDGKIPWDEETWRGGYVMRAPKGKKFPKHLNT